MQQNKHDLQMFICRIGYFEIHILMKKQKSRLVQTAIYIINPRKVFMQKQLNSYIDS